MAAQIIFTYAIMIVVLLVGFDFLTKAGGFQPHYRRAVRGVGRFFWRQFISSFRWLWVSRWWRLVAGFAAGVLTALYAMGYFR